MGNKTVITKQRYVKLNKISKLINEFEFDTVMHAIVADQYQKERRKETWKNHFNNIISREI